MAAAPLRANEEIIFEKPSITNAFKIKRNRILTKKNGKNGKNVSYSVYKKSNGSFLSKNEEESLAERMKVIEEDRIFLLENIPSLGDGTHICTFILYEKDGELRISLIKVFSSLEHASQHNTLVFTTQPDKLFAAGEMEITIANGIVTRIRFNLESGTYMRPHIDDYNGNTESMIAQKQKQITKFVVSKGFPKPVYNKYSFIPKSWVNMNEFQRLKRNYGFVIQEFTPQNQTRLDKINIELARLEAQLKFSSSRIESLRQKIENTSKEGAKQMFQRTLQEAEQIINETPQKISNLTAEKKAIYNRSPLIGGGRKTMRKRKTRKNK